MRLGEKNLRREWVEEFLSGELLGGKEGVGKKELEGLRRELEVVRPEGFPAVRPPFSLLPSPIQIQINTNPNEPSTNDNDFPTYSSSAN